VTTQYIQKRPHLFQFLDLVQQKENICSQQTHSLGSTCTYTKNALSRVFGVFKAHGACLLAANVFPPRKRTEFPHIHQLGLRGNFEAGGREEQREKKGTEKDNSKHPPPWEPAGFFQGLAN